MNTYINIDRTMYGAFRYMMTNNIFSSEKATFVGLKSMCHIFKDCYEFTDNEIQQALIAFFRNYNQGTKQPMSESYIKTVIIPAILSEKTIDIEFGTTLIDAGLR